MRLTEGIAKGIEVHVINETADQAWLAVAFTSNRSTELLDGDCSPIEMYNTWWFCILVHFESPYCFFDL